MQKDILQNMPKPNTKRIAIRVTNVAERQIRQRHPWVFESAITKQSHAGKAGDLAVIFDKKGKFLAVGLYDPSSMIRVRILQFFKPADIDQAWLNEQLYAASLIREPLMTRSGTTLTNGYRLVYGENDALPALVVDRYADTLVVKLYSAAWIPWLPDLLSVLKQVQAHDRVVLRLSRAVQKDKQYLYGLEDGMVLYGEPLDGPVLFQENGIAFEAEPVIGQKTGFFLDQRENRRRVELLAKDKSVLNVFAYTGGFSVYAGRGGAKEVVSVDISEPAIHAAQRNWDHNLVYKTIQQAQHSGIAEDAFLVLENMAKAGRKFDIVILDPPMFAHKQEQVNTALRAYQRLTRLGLGVLKSGGVLVQASCSSRVSAEQFFEGIGNTVQQMGRKMTEIERSGHPLDHPVKIREGAYLKCLFARVD